MRREFGAVSRREPSTRPTVLGRKMNTPSAAALAAILLITSCSTEQEQANPATSYYIESYVPTEPIIMQIKECRRDLEVIRREHEDWMSSIRQISKD
jgi:hypothetical protein